MSDTALIQLLAHKTGATLGKEFSVATDDRIILDRALTHKVVNLYLQGDGQLKPLISQIRVEADDLNRAVLNKSPDFFNRSIERSLSRCRELYSPDLRLGDASRYFFLFYGGIATKFGAEQYLAHSLFRTLTGTELDLAVADPSAVDLESLLSLVYEDILKSAIDPLVTSVERYGRLVRDRAWLEYWEMPM